MFEHLAKKNSLFSLFILFVYFISFHLFHLILFIYFISSILLILLSGGCLWELNAKDCVTYLDDVLEFDAEKGVWKKIGSMTNKRGSHAVSVINYGAIKAYCN